VTVARTFSRGVLKGYGKTSRSRRRVQLSAGAKAALDAIVPAPRLTAALPGPRGARIDLHNFRAREWIPALEAAGLPRKRIYDLRHTAISHWLAAGLGSFGRC
jgi:integrase